MVDDAGQRALRTRHIIMHSATEVSIITLVDQTLKIVSLIKAFRSRVHFIGRMLFPFLIFV